MTELLNGKQIATDIRAHVTAVARELRTAGVLPALAIVVATKDESISWYVRSIVKAAEKAGLEARLIELPPNSQTTDIEAVLGELAVDATVHGIILQTPLPDGVHLDDLAELIPPNKDIDGISPVSMGRLVLGHPAFVPATAAAVMELLRRHGIELAGRRAVVIGRSAVVGKPVAQLLLRENATVTVCHSRTVDLAAVTREAEVLVVSVGKARLVGREHVRPGAVIVDVGTNTDASGALVGDVDAEAVTGVAGALTPVPGGVGPVTTALLLQHTVTAAAQATGAAV
jgi:methylenetetrahydrofolate dehydrogenase (NADP+)/methenyltetrahydrofolate cyclohydrolase